MKILLEGIDGTGKSTLVKMLAEEFGISVIKHLGKPKAIKRYGGDKIKYQKDVFKRFNKIVNSNTKIAYDRAHLGEFVYGPLYRGEACLPIEEIEKGFGKDVLLILLVANNFDILRDDGLGFDIANQEKEQDLFIEAFKSSSINNKIIIEVHNDDGFKPLSEIKEEIMNRKTTGERVYIPRNAWWANDIDYAKKLSDTEKDWLLDFNSGLYDNKVKNNPVFENASEELLDEMNDDYNSRKKCVLNRGLGNLYEERSDYENINVPEAGRTEELHELAKKGIEEANDIISAEYEDLVNSGLLSQDEADFGLHHDRQILMADEKKMRAKRYSKLTKAELKANKQDR